MAKPVIYRRRSRFAAGFSLGLLAALTLAGAGVLHFIKQGDTCQITRQALRALRPLPISVDVAVPGCLDGVQAAVELDTLRLEVNKLRDRLEPARRTPPASANRSLPNLALGQPTTTNKTARDTERKPRWAVDGDEHTTWLAGDLPPQWIRVELDAPTPVTRLRMLIRQTPTPVESYHRILLLDSKEQMLYVAHLTGITRDGQWLEHRVEQDVEDVRFVKIETLRSKSWVAWGEIQVFGES